MMNRNKSKKPLASDDFYFISHVHDPQIDPSGQQAAYVFESPQREGRSYSRSIWMVNLKTGKSRQFTSGMKDGDSNPAWSPDGKTLAFVSGRGGRPQIYLISIDGGEARQFTSMKNGAYGTAWSPDGKSIAFISRTREEERTEEDQPSKSEKFLNEHAAKMKEEEAKYQEELRIDPRIYTRTLIRQGTVFKDDRNSHIYIQKTDGGKPERITGGISDFGEPVWSPDGKYLVTSTKKKGDPDIVVRSDLVKIDIKTKKITSLTNDDNGNFGAQITKDGKWVYYLSFQSEKLYQQRMKLRRIPLKGGTPEELMPEYDFEVQEFHLHEQSGNIFFVSPQFGKEHIHCVGMMGGHPRQITDGCRMLGPFSVSGNTMVFRVESPDMPSEIFCSKIDGSQEKRLTRINRKFLSNRSLSLPEEVWLERPDGFKVQGWIMKPHGYVPGHQYPWVVQVHGGPHIMWGYSWWHEFQSMCAKGYGVYFSNPRGSDGYGSEFKGAIHLRWGEEDSKDILAGADWVVRKGFADPKKLYLTGGSFGGFMTAWLVGHDHRFKAAAAQRGVYDFISMYGVSDANTLVEWEFDTLPWENTQLLWDHSPLKYVQNVKTPLMILHSEQDYRVGISEADELYVALKRLGKEAEFVRYPREGHELSRSGEPLHRVDRINKIIGWFDRHP